jgi:Na+/H+ antiporter NhaA
MKKVIITVLLAIAALVILLQSGVFDSLALFILAGIIPGTKYAVPSTFMLLLMMSVAWVVVFSLLPLSTLRSSTASGKKHRTKLNNQLPKRRFREV